MSSLHPRDHALFVAPPPPLTPAGPTALDPVTGAAVAHADRGGATLEVRTAAGRTGMLRLRPATGNTLRVTLRMADVPTAPRVAVVTAATDTGCTVERSPNTLTPHLDALRADIHLSPFAMELTDHQGLTLRQATDVSDPSDRTTVLPFGVTELRDGRLAHRQLDHRTRRALLRPR
ncbi:hypothetical protein [Streptomyces sp. NBC_01235]|uniref:hypothetical protein n=1 Tax=Streptomyces sp. NBC_01235 TaxID=2903788 RepID=UPI002E12DE09|nr:hypothetical protein OG289_05375 [Streptomyces sp. NBC_01235]